MTETNEGYQKLQVISDWTTRIELGGKPLDFNKYYDIKTPKGRSFEGCRVYSSTHHTEGYGGMSEDSTIIIPFFEADGLEAILQSGFLMRVNEKVTSKKHAKKSKKERRDKIQRLYEERNELDREITELESQ